MLLAACLLLLLAAKPGRSTLDTKKGYKTKTGSTSSVTRTLTSIEYWDRAGGGRNIVLETLTTNEVRTGKWTRAAQNGAQNELYSSVWAPQLDWDHVWKTMVLTHFLSHLWSQSGPFSRPVQPCEGPKLLKMGTKWTHSTCLCTPNSPKVSLEHHSLIHF